MTWQSLLFRIHLRMHEAIDHVETSIIKSREWMAGPSVPMQGLITSISPLASRQMLNITGARPICYRSTCFMVLK